MTVPPSERVDAVSFISFTNFKKSRRYFWAVEWRANKTFSCTSCQKAKTRTWHGFHFRATFSKPLEEESIHGNGINCASTPIHVSFLYTSISVSEFSLSASVASQANSIRSSTGSLYRDRPRPASKQDRLWCS